MKSLLFACGFLAFALSGCGAGNDSTSKEREDAKQYDSPEEVVSAYLQAMIQRDRQRLIQTLIPPWRTFLRQLDPSVQALESAYFDFEKEVKNSFGADALSERYMRQDQDSHRLKFELTKTDKPGAFGAICVRAEISDSSGPTGLDPPTKEVRVYALKIGTHYYVCRLMTFRHFTAVEAVGNWIKYACSPQGYPWIGALATTMSASERQRRIDESRVVIDQVTEEVKKIHRAVSDGEFKSAGEIETRLDGMRKFIAAVQLKREQRLMKPRVALDLGYHRFEVRCTGVVAKKGDFHDELDCHWWAPLIQRKKYSDESAWSHIMEQHRRGVHEVELYGSLAQEIPDEIPEELIPTAPITVCVDDGCLWAFVQWAIREATIAKLRRFHLVGNEQETWEKTITWTHGNREKSTRYECTYSNDLGPAIELSKADQPPPMTDGELYLVLQTSYRPRETTVFAENVEPMKLDEFPAWLAKTVEGDDVPNKQNIRIFSDPFTRFEHIRFVMESAEKHGTVVLDVGKPPFNAQ